MPDLVSCTAGDRLVAGQIFRVTLTENWRAALLPGSQLVEVYNDITTLAPGLYPISEPPLANTGVAVIDIKVGPSGVHLGTVAQLVNVFAALSAVDVTRVERLASQQAATAAGREQVRTKAETARAEGNPLTRLFQTAKTVTYVAVAGLVVVGGLLAWRLAKQSGVIR